MGRNPANKGVRLMKRAIREAKEDGMNPVSQNMKAAALKQMKFKDFRRQLFEGNTGKKIVSKVIEVAMDDEHPQQVACLKMCFDRLMPQSKFEDATESGFSGGVTIVFGSVGDKMKMVSGEVVDQIPEVVEKEVEEAEDGEGES